MENCGTRVLKLLRKKIVFRDLEFIIEGITEEHISETERKLIEDLSEKYTRVTLTNWEQYVMRKYSSSGGDSGPKDYTSFDYFSF